MNELSLMMPQAMLVCVWCVGRARPSAQPPANLDFRSALSKKFVL
jgi:hypothetical protein